MSIGLDPKWICSAIDIDGQHPVNAEFVGFIGTGQMSRNVRFALNWSGDASGLPTTVVVKLPSADTKTLKLSFDHGVYQRECEFYRCLAGKVDVAVPHSFKVHFDPDGQAGSTSANSIDGNAGADFAIVLEDLATYSQGDQFVELNIDQLLRATEQAAALHAPIWGQVDGREFDLYRQDPQAHAANTAQMMQAFMPTVFNRLGDRLEPDVVDLLNQFVNAAGDWVLARMEATLEGSRATLVHGDFRSDNFMFANEDSERPLVVVDWQTTILGLGATDIAYLLGAAVSPATRTQIETEVLHRYVNVLASRGVDYPIEQCTADYRLASLYGVVVAVMATSMANQTERGDALFSLMLNRHGRHSLDAAALSLI